MLNNKTCSFITFGCKVNQYDTQALRERLAANGYEEVDPVRSPARHMAGSPDKSGLTSNGVKPSEAPSTIIVNTCTVTETAYREARTVVKKIGRENPNARIIVTGCAAVSNKEEFLGLPNVSAVVSNAELGLRNAKGKSGIRISDLGVQSSLLSTHSSQLATQRISYFKGHTRAFLKVQDGCDLNCSFCIIPYVRGGNVSRKIEDVIDDAKRLADKGYKEIVLTGVHLGSYGKDLDGRSGGVAMAVKKISRIDGIRRIRLSSIEVNEITSELIEMMASGDKLCPHLHLPLQSGDDEVLHRMRRRYNTVQFLSAIDRVNERVSEAAFTTDVIVGFPGETEGNFENTLEVCRRVGFSRIHIFPYSHRSGTDASRMPETVSPAEKKGRFERLKKLAGELMHNYYKRFEGREVEVLVESKDGANSEGDYEADTVRNFSSGNYGINLYKRYATEGISNRAEFSGYSERYIKVVILGDIKVGDLVKATVTKVGRNYVEARA